MLVSRQSEQRRICSTTVDAGHTHFNGVHQSKQVRVRLFRYVRAHEVSQSDDVLDVMSAEASAGDNLCVDSESVDTKRERVTCMCNKVKCLCMVNNVFKTGTFKGVPQICN